MTRPRCSHCGHACRDSWVEYVIARLVFCSARCEESYGPVDKLGSPCDRVWR